MSQASTAPDLDARPHVLRRAKLAVYLTFGANGFAFASWAARLPQLREHLGLTPGRLGLVILCVALGSLISLPTTGFVVHQIGEGRTVAIMCSTLAAGLVLLGIGYHVGTLCVAGGFLVIGLGNGAWDVAMNVQGAHVERLIGRSIMPRFHAAFSIGTVAGAGVSAAVVAIGLGVPEHLWIVAALIVATNPYIVLHGFLKGVVEHEPGASRAAVFAAWRDPRTLLVGVFVMCMAFTEGTGNDWLSVASVDGYHTSNTVGALTLACFLAAMTTGRWFGPGLIDRYGRVWILRAFGVLALGGLALVVYGHWYGVAVLGALMWGAGTSLGDPVGISAAADDPASSAARVSVVASIAYLAFLGGPPLVGFVGDHTGVLRSLTVAAALLTIAILISGACAPRRAPESPNAPLDPPRY
jgi:predicted MFS family arabinose efflux permease